MTNKQRVAAIRRARRHLHDADGYRPNGVHYREIDKVLNALEKDLLPKVPNLGPVRPGGVSLLDQDLTHPTGGLALYPALDDAFSKDGGVTVIAPEFLTVTRDSSSRPGDAFYATGRSGLRYWFGHLVKAPPVGTRFAKGAPLGKTLNHRVGGGPHVHVGINIEERYGEGKELIHHTNYTHGAPKVGAQLEKLEALRDT